MQNTNTTANAPVYQVITTRNATHAEEKRQQTPAEIYEEAKEALIPDLFKIVLSYYHMDIRNALKNDEIKLNIYNYTTKRDIWGLLNDEVFLYTGDFINIFMYRYIISNKSRYDIKIKDITDTRENIKNRTYDITQNIKDCYFYDEKKEHNKTINEIHNKDYYNYYYYDYDIKAQRQLKINYIQDSIMNNRKLTKRGIDYLNAWLSYDNETTTAKRIYTNREIRRYIPKQEDIIYKDIIYNDRKKGRYNTYSFLNCYYKSNYLYGMTYKPLHITVKFKDIKKISIYTTRTKPDINKRYLITTTHIKIDNNIYDYAQLRTIDYNTLLIRDIKRQKRIGHKHKRTIYKGYIQTQTQQDKDIYNMIYGRLYDKVINQIKDDIIRYESDDESTDEDTTSEDTISDSSYYSEGENEDGCATCRKFCECEPVYITI